MEDTTMSTHQCTGEGCSHESHADEPTSEPTPSSTTMGNEEMALAFLLAIVPLVVLTFFGQVGLI